MIRITLNKPTSYQVAQCELFARHAAAQSFIVYQSRGSASFVKIEEDIFVGKIAECLAWNALFTSGFNPSVVDFSLYNRDKRDYSPDLVIKGGLGVHVKSHIKSEYENSWVFQLNDPVMHRMDEVLFLCTLDLSRDYAGEAIVCRVSEAKFDEPQIKKYKSIKTCIYEKSFNLDVTGTTHPAFPHGSPDSTQGKGINPHT